MAQHNRDPHTVTVNGQKYPRIGSLVTTKGAKEKQKGGGKSRGDIAQLAARSLVDNEPPKVEYQMFGETHSFDSEFMEEMMTGYGQREWVASEYPAVDLAIVNDHNYDGFGEHSNPVWAWKERRLEAINEGVAIIQENTPRDQQEAALTEYFDRSVSDHATRLWMADTADNDVLDDMDLEFDYETRQYAMERALGQHHESYVDDQEGVDADPDGVSSYETFVDNLSESEIDDLTNQELACGAYDENGTRPTETPDAKDPAARRLYENAYDRLPYKYPEYSVNDYIADRTHKDEAPAIASREERPWGPEGESVIDFSNVPEGATEIRFM